MDFFFFDRAFFSSSSRVWLALDDRIDEFADLVRKHYGVDEFADPNAATEVCPSRSIMQIIHTRARKRLLSSGGSSMTQKYQRQGQD